MVARVMERRLGSQRVAIRMILTILKVELPLLVARRCSSGRFIVNILVSPGKGDSAHLLVKHLRIRSGP